jgi:replicative DNA helicase
MTDTFVPGPGPEAEPDDRPAGAARVRARREAGLRVPPQALDAERAVLAAMMLDSTAIAAAVQSVMPDDFYRPAHRKICAAVYRMFEKNEAVDAITLSQELASAGDLEAVGGQVHLAEILDAAVTAANVEYHARIVREKSLLRQMIRATQEIAEEAFTAPDDVNAFIDRAEHKMFEISESGPRKGFVAVKDLLQESFDKIEELYNEKRLVTGVPTGFVDLDTLTSGFQKSDFVVVAARPSMGKTAFTLNVAEHVSVDHRLPVAFFSLEMSKEALVQRLLSSLSHVDGNRLRTGFLRENEWPRLTTAAGKLSEAELWIDDTAGITALEIRAKARRLMVETRGRLAMVVVDYLQLIRGHGRTENRQQEISHISRSLKALAKELRIPVVALSQLKRPTDAKEGGRRPVLSDLRECVTGDTLAVLTDGRRVPVRNLVGTMPEVVAVDGEGRLTSGRSDRVWCVGRRPVFEVKLASGRSVRATGEHRLLTGSGWAAVSSIAAGDRLALARVLPEPPRPETWPEARLVLLGHLVGDGSYLAGQPMRYTTASEANSAAVAAAARGEFGAEVKRYAGRGRWHQLLISGNGNRWHPAGVNAWLRSLRIFGQRSFEKRIPEEAFRLHNGQIATLLRHLWATDGTVYRRPARARGSHGIEYSTTSPGLAKDVAALLLRLGIVARVHAVPQGRYRPAHMVSVSGSAFQSRFLEVVGAFGPKTAAARGLAAAVRSTRAGTNVDTLPRGVFERVRRRMRALGVTQRDMARMRGTSYGGDSHFRFAPSRTVRAEYAALLGDSSLRAAATSDLFWDRVAAVGPCGEEDVFDLTVPGPACWLADGIVSHNSGAIEQDADVVIFIHRPEVYGVQEKEGLAEIIIGKQRNGPIGITELAFQKTITRFENLARVRE